MFRRHRQRCLERDKASPGPMPLRVGYVGSAAATWGSRQIHLRSACEAIQLANRNVGQQEFMNLLRLITSSSQVGTLVISEKNKGALDSNTSDLVDMSEEALAKIELRDLGEDQHLDVLLAANGGPLVQSETKFQHALGKRIVFLRLGTDGMADGPEVKFGNQWMQQEPFVQSDRIGLGGPDREMLQGEAHSKFNDVLEKLGTSQVVESLPAPDLARKSAVVDQVQASSSSAAAKAKSATGYINIVERKNWYITIVERKNWLGSFVMGTCDAVLLINVLTVMLGTVPEIMYDRPRQQWLFFIEVACSGVFALHYAMHICAYGIEHALHPMRLIDLCCLLPALLLPLLPEDHAHENVWSRSYELERVLQVLLVFRVVRILDFPALRRNTSILCRAILEAIGNLGLPMIFALYVWVFASCLFTYTEVYVDGIAQRDLSSIPAAMYWCSIFLVGEWSTVDFSPGAGSRLCILFSILSIMAYAIPIGVISESIQSTLAMVAQERAGLHELDAVKERNLQALLGSRRENVLVNATVGGSNGKTGRKKDKPSGAPKSEAAKSGDSDGSIDL